MNMSSVLGLLLAIAVAIGTAATSTDNWKVFLDPHAFVVVMGGTFAAALLSFSGSKMLGLMKTFFKKVIGKNEEVHLAISEIVDVAKGYRDNENYIKEVLPKLKTHFLKEALSLMNEGGFDPAEIEGFLKKRASTMNHRYEEDAEIFKTLAKFPPAFGLMGAVVGMISMMQSLGGADAFSKVGPSLAVALVATLYGIALANFIFLPLGENLTKLNKVDATIRSMVIEGVRLIRLKKHPLVVEESIKSHLLPSERGQKKKAA